MMKDTITVDFKNLTEDEKKTLMGLVSKSNKLVSKVWKPEVGETCFRLYGEGSIIESNFNNSSAHYYAYNMGFIAETQKELENKIEWLKIHKQLEDFAKEHNEYEIDWIDNGQGKWCICYDHFIEKLCASYNHSVKSNNIYFTSTEIAEQAIMHIGEDRLKKYYFGVED